MARKSKKTLKVSIGFSTPKNRAMPFPFLIRLRHGTKFSHSYWRFHSAAWGVDFIYQNSGMHTNFTGAPRFEKINQVISEFELDLTEDIVASLGRLCVLREGKGYSVGQILWKGALWLAELVTFGKWSPKNPFPDSDEATDCIEEAAKVLSEGLNISVPLDMDSIAIKPWFDFVAGLPSAKLVKGSE
jgi:hypothetical protein